MKEGVVMELVKSGAARRRAPVYLTVAEVAELLRIRPRTVYQMVSQRRIPFRKAGRTLLFEESEIDRWTKEGARG